jgi:hypothetical protein
MRPVQQNRRMRGRGNNNNRSKGPNPLSRNYESNGPDVKIRGNAQHVAEKYTTLARDAQSSGDRVMAENYLQHAEHYNRIILAAQAQAPVQYQRDDRDDQDDDGVYDDDGNEQQQDRPVQHQQINLQKLPMAKSRSASVSRIISSAGSMIKIRPVTRTHPTAPTAMWMKPDRTTRMPPKPSQHAAPRAVAGQPVHVNRV